MSADVVRLPVEWTHIRTGAAYTLTGLSNLHSENREEWPVMAHYTGADGCRWTRTLGSFLGAMRAVTGRRMGTESVPEEVPGLGGCIDLTTLDGWSLVNDAANTGHDGWTETIPDTEWRRGGHRVIRTERFGGAFSFILSTDDGKVRYFHSPRAAFGFVAKDYPEEVQAVPEPDVAEATLGLPAGWREVVPGRVWARGARVTVRGSMDGSDIPFHVHVDGCRFLSVESMDTAIHYADKWYPATNYPD